MNLPAFALIRRMGRLRLSALFPFLHGGSESTRNLAYKIDKAVGRLPVIR